MNASSAKFSPAKSHQRFRSLDGSQLIADRHAVWNELKPAGVHHAGGKHPAGPDPRPAGPERALFRQGPC